MASNFIREGLQRSLENRQRKEEVNKVNITENRDWRVQEL